MIIFVGATLVAITLFAPLALIFSPASAFSGF